jgi:hypothetical protein
VQGALGGLSGDIATTGSIITTASFMQIDRSGDLTNASLFIDSDAAFQANIHFRTSGSDRWVIGKNADPETGINRGSLFNIDAYSDTGAFVGMF